jgi:hypothetical protein
MKLKNKVEPCLDKISTLGQFISECPRFFYLEKILGNISILMKMNKNIGTWRIIK